MPNLEEVSEWLRYSQTDLNSANFLLQMYPMPIEVICYHCQQSAEKALKAFLLANDKKIIKTHDLRFLQNECGAIDKDFSSLSEYCSMLTVYGVESRYPWTMEIEESDMKIALKDAAAIFNFVQEKIRIIFNDDENSSADKSEDSDIEKTSV